MTTTQELIEMAKANIIAIRELRAEKKEWRAENRERDRKFAAARELADKEWKKELRAEKRELRAEKKELRAEKKELRAENRELRAENRERDRKNQAARELAEKDRKEWRASMKSLRKELAGIGFGNGDMAEEFFYRGLQESMCLGKLHFDKIERNIHPKKGSGEIDIFLFNATVACVIEVKYRVHPAEIPNLIEKKLVFIRKEYPKYSQIYFGIASMSTSDLVIQMAQKEGIFLLTQGGDNIKVICDQVKNF